MARGIQLAFTLNPRDFLKGLKQIEVDLEDVKDTLDDVEDAASDAFDDLDTGDAERGLRDVKDGLEDVERAAEDAEGAFGGLSGEAKSELGKVETAAQQAGAEVESELKQGAKDAEKAFGKLGSSAKADMKKVENAADRAGDEVDEVGDEAGQSAKEFGASFRGDPIEALEEVQALGAEIALKTIPGIGGAAAAIGGGILFGFIISQFEKLREAAEELREKVRDLRDEYLDLSDVDFANIGELSTFDRFIERLDEVGVGLDDFQDKVDKASPKAQELYDAFKLSGTTDDLLAFLRQLRVDINLTGDEYDDVSKDLLNDTGPLRDIFEDAADQAAYARDNFSDAALGLDEVNAAANEAVEPLSSVAEETERLSDAASDAADAVRGLNDEFVTADEAADNYKQTVEDTKEAIEELTEDGVMPFSGALANNTEAQREGKKALRELAQAGLENAAAIVEMGGSTNDAREATEKARQKFIEAGKQMGLSEEAAEAYADELNLIPEDVVTQITVNNTKALYDIAKVRAELLSIQDRYVSVFITEVKRDEAAASRGQQQGARPPT